MADFKSEDAFELRSAVQLLIAQMKDVASGTTEYSRAAAETLAIEEEKRKAAQKGLDLEEKSNEEKKKAKEATKNLKDAAKQLGTEFIKITEAGVKFASTIGTEATNGVRLELQNRLAAVKQILTLDANRAASLAQIQAAEQSLGDAFISVRDGFRLSSNGAAQFANNLKGGFKSEFQLTAESLRALVTTGMATEAQFENFRRASGRASLSSGQFATIVNKNSLSFMLYGNKFAEAAVKAERLGVNLAGVQAAQEGLVTNLDGTIDTVAQLNQLGAQVDFGNLVRIAEQEGPDALMAYVRATVPEQLMQSASTRALFKQLGISVEDYLKSGQKQQSAADQIETQMTEAAKQTGFANKAITLLTKAYTTGAATFGGLVIALVSAIRALNAFAVAAASKTPGLATGAAALSKALSIGTGLTVGVGGAAMGRSLAEEGKVGAGVLTGILSGAASGALIGGSAGLGFGAIPGAIIGALIAGGYAATGANDLYSAGYGSRTLATPNGVFALNNADDIIAGTNLFPKGALQMGSDNSELIGKINNLIDSLSNANTVINVGGAMQTVPRLQLVEVRSRNER